MEKIELEYDRIGDMLTLWIKGREGHFTDYIEGYDDYIFSFTEGRKFAGVEILAFSKRLEKTPKIEIPLDARFEDTEGYPHYKAAQEEAPKKATKIKA